MSPQAVELKLQQIPKITSFLSTGLLQRKCACGQQTIAGGECEDCQQKQSLWQRHPVNQAEPSEVPPIVHEVLRSQGQPLDSEVRNFMEPRFGHDFSQVRVHTDTKAAQSARAVNALAYTLGQDIVFGTGQYMPHTSTGQQLVAHELTHVMQQRGSVKSLQTQLYLGAQSNLHEQEADHVAQQVMNGARVSVPSLLSANKIQRAMICSKRLEAPGLGLFFNHAYIDDTGRNDCLGAGLVGNYAITQLISGNFIRGCAVKTDRSPDPRSRTPNRKPCEPKEGVTDVSRCLRDAFSRYNNPSLYANPSGPNSNTFAGTLARACCKNASSRGLGWVPGWRHSPARPCPQHTLMAESAEDLESEPTA